jgi:hypothetical protein
LSTPPALFAFVILEIGSHFCPGHPRWQSSWFMLPAVAGMTGAHHYTQPFSFEMRSHELLLPRLTWNHDPPPFQPSK